MTRRSTRKPVSIPAGWTQHDGSGIPVPERSCPAIIFRIGTRVKAGSFEAAHWRDRADDSWTWREGSKAPMDIVAYQAEPDEWVVVPEWPESVGV